MKRLILITLFLGAITARAITPQELAQLRANEAELRTLNEAQSADLEATRSELAASKDETASIKQTADTLKASEVSARTDLNAAQNRLNYIEPKYTAAVAIIWKWRICAIGTWVILAGLIAAKFYLKFPIP